MSLAHCYPSTAGNLPSDESPQVFDDNTRTGARRKEPTVTQIIPTALPVEAARVDALLAQGRTLPAVFYTSADIAELEQRLIFRRSWQLAGTTVELARPGDYLTLTIAKVPIVVARGKDDVIRAFVNVCTHRAQTVIEGAGNCKNLQCGYHGWTFGLDGTLSGVPGWRTAELPDFESLALRPVPVEVWEGLVFVALEPEQTLTEQLGELPEVMEQTGYDFPFGRLDGLRLVGDYTRDIPCNWKVYQENSSECYHCPTTHPGSFGEVFDITEVHLNARSFNGGGGAFAPYPMRPEVRARFPEEKAGSQYGYAQYFLWPNTLVITGYVGEAVFRMEPTAVDRTRQVGWGYSRPEAISPELTALIDVTFTETTAEDMSVVERVQQGLTSGLFESGPTSTDRETRLRHFQQRVWSALRPAFSGLES